MVKHTLASAAELLAALRACAVTSALGTIVDLASTRFAIDLAGTDWVGTKSRLIVSIAGTTSYTGYFSLSTPVTTSRVQADDVANLFTSNYDAAYTFGSNGDQIELTNMAGVFGWARITPAADVVSSFALWKKTSSVDSVVRYYANANPGGSTSYYGKGFLSPYISACSWGGSSYRSIAGDGFTQDSVITQSSNGLAIDTMDTFIPWRLDLTLASTGFTVGSKVYHFLGRVGEGAGYMALRTE